MSGIKDYSTTPASNTTLFPEGMAPSAVNDGMRQVQADIRSWYNDSQWVIYGDGDGAFTIAYVSPTSFSVTGADVTTVYHAGRRVKAFGPLTGTIYGTIQSAVFATNTTVTVLWDSGSFCSEPESRTRWSSRSARPAAESWTRSRSSAPPLNAATLHLPWPAPPAVSALPTRSVRRAARAAAADLPPRRSATASRRARPARRSSTTG